MGKNCFCGDSAVYNGFFGNSNFEQSSGIHIFEGEGSLINDPKRETLTNI